MQPSRKLDASIAGFVALSLPLMVLFAGDPLFVGLWYYLVVSASALGLAAALRTKPLFLCGTSLAVATTFVAYMLVNWRAAHPEGLLVLGHMSSLPGAVIGLILGVIAARRTQHPATVLMLALMSILGGFFINQVVVCNTLIWCGPLSMDIG
ncbi:hypothetical protein [Dokdonella sp.]|uniref:hypothetical protein n=1 Tax=Dokdonella sp. TaxID=2291710 RepID=UPI003C573CF2